MSGSNYLAGLANVDAALTEAILGQNFADYAEISAPVDLGSVQCGTGNFLTGIPYGQIGLIDDTLCFGCGEFYFSGKEHAELQSGLAS